MVECSAATGSGMGISFYHTVMHLLHTLGGQHTCTKPQTNLRAPQRLNLANQHAKGTRAPNHHRQFERYMTSSPRTKIHHHNHNHKHNQQDHYTTKKETKDLPTTAPLSLNKEERQTPLHHKDTFLHYYCVVTPPTLPHPLSPASTQDGAGMRRGSEVHSRPSLASTSSLTPLDQYPASRRTLTHAATKFRYSLPACMLERGERTRE
ncbi:hypothetical protein E2C01_013020 [Portunus trituberculatus]|uniref:Uncharacterized protein n=1 Tax=Portunus trituberculatus TaxID=210409 RepID=A0A5B7DFZ1_PORTR|nr:hypothetical protein [Portunus trituberculatus]